MAISQKIVTYMEKGSWIRKMFEEGARLKAQHGEDRVFDFSLGNPPEEPPEAFQREFRRLAENPIPGMHRYMPNAGFLEAREAVARSIAAETGLPVEAAHVVMTVGAGGALNVALKALLDPDDEVIVLSPFFPEYPIYIDNHGGKTVFVSTNPAFTLDLWSLDRAITARTKAILLNSPHNPTGVVYPEKEIEALGALLRQKKEERGWDIYVISDEPYRKLLYDGVRFPHIFRYIENGLVATSHSKDLALPGERIGYLAISPRCADGDRLSRAIVFTNRILGYVNAPALMQLIVARLQGVTIDISSYQERRDLLYNQLTAMGFEMVKPQGAFYLFPKSPVEDDIAFVQAASQKLVLITPGTGFGCPGHFRISYAVPKEMIERSIPAWQALAREFGLPG